MLPPLKTEHELIITERTGLILQNVKHNKLYFPKSESEFAKNEPSSRKTKAQFVLFSKIRGIKLMQYDLYPLNTRNNENRIMLFEHSNRTNILLCYQNEVYF